jgi:MFS family permease
VLITVLRERNLRVLFAGQTLNMFGMSAMILTLSIWVVTLTDSPGAAGLVFVFLVLPTIAAPFWGLLVDRFPRRRVLIVNDSVAAVLVSTLLTVHDRGDVWLIYLVTLGYGVSGQIYRAARGGLVHSIVPADLLGDVNGMFSSLGQGMRIAGPLAGAGLFAAAGGHAVAILDAVTFLLSVGFYLLLRNVPDLAPRQTSKAAQDSTGHDSTNFDSTNFDSTERDKPEQDKAEQDKAEQDKREQDGTGQAAGARRLVTELMAGARHVLTTPELRRMVLASAIAFGCAGSVNVAIYALIADGLGRPATFIGLLVAVQGAGSIVAGLLIGALMRRVGEFGAASIGFLLNAAGMLAVSTAVLPGVVVGALISGLGLPTVLVAEITLLQRRTAKELQGRVIAASDAIIDIPYAIGIGIAGLIIGTVGFRPVYLFDAAVFVAVGLAVLRFRSLTKPEPAPAAATAAATPQTE